jgi:hypothetical protein
MMEAIFQAQEDLKVNYFLVMVDMATTSLKRRFEELQSGSHSKIYLIF